MGFYKYMREAWEKPRETLGDLYLQRLIVWRRDPAILRLDGPTRLDRARSLGYKAKQGVFVARVRVLRGGHFRPKIVGGRRPKTNRRVKIVGKSYQWIAEERVQDRFPNCEVLNSYLVAQDGKHYWYEVILVDRDHPSVLADKNLAWINQSHHHGRVYRGLTASGRRSRGILTHKGKGAEKLRPSLRAHDGLAK